MRIIQVAPCVLDKHFQVVAMGAVEAVRIVFMVGVAVDLAPVDDPAFPISRLPCLEGRPTDSMRLGTPGTKQICLRSRL